MGFLIFWNEDSDRLRSNHSILLGTRRSLVPPSDLIMGLLRIHLYPRKFRRKARLGHWGVFTVFNLPG
ncbi:hypothetical protein CY34DRAFT_806266 [Suillus luteus UH-Slu-Lm8-n1]|uniref:Uncharacterized protein n=1 Tax=Suillus luteus UH-Slu-Lm8-n1 TaxID=930992 RepID=A0A0C9ZTP1_9AGAM|nr:hypothetical protein CY34DRAFT_806266 [Suillus luteus UH-Slu-Lm8-n1]